MNLFLLVAVVSGASFEKTCDFKSVEKLIEFLTANAEHVNLKGVASPAELKIESTKPDKRDLCFKIPDAYVRTIWKLATAPVEPLYRAISVQKTLEFIKSILRTSVWNEANRYQEHKDKVKLFLPEGTSPCRWYRTPAVMGYDLTITLLVFLIQATKCKSLMNPSVLIDFNNKSTEVCEKEFTKYVVQRLKLGEAELVTADGFYGTSTKDSRSCFLYTLRGDSINAIIHAVNSADQARAVLRFLLSSYDFLNNAEYIDLLKLKFQEINLSGDACKYKVRPLSCRGGLENVLCLVRYLEAVMLCDGLSLDSLRDTTDDLLMHLTPRHPEACELKAIPFLYDSLEDMLEQSQKYKIWKNKRNENDKNEYEELDKLYTVKRNPDLWESEKKRALGNEGPKFHEFAPIRHFLSPSGYRTVQPCDGKLPLQYPSTFVNRTSAELLVMRLSIITHLFSIKLTARWEYVFAILNDFTRRVESKENKQNASTNLKNKLPIWPAIPPRRGKHTSFHSNPDGRIMLLKAGDVEVEEALIQLVKKKDELADEKRRWIELLSEVSLHILASLPAATIKAARLLLGQLDKSLRPAFVVEVAEDCNVSGTYKDFQPFEEKYMTPKENYLLPLYLFLVKRYSCGKPHEGVENRQNYVNLLLTPLGVKDDPGDDPIPGPTPDFPPPEPPVINDPPKDIPPPPAPDVIIDPPPVIPATPEPDAKLKFKENLEDYVNKLTMAGIPAAEAATRVQVQASLAELAQRALEELEKLDEIEKDCDAKIKSTFMEMKKVVKERRDGTTGKGGIQGIGNIESMGREGKNHNP